MTQKIAMIRYQLGPVRPTLRPSQTCAGRQHLQPRSELESERRARPEVIQAPQVHGDGARQRRLGNNGAGECPSVSRGRHLAAVDGGSGGWS